jgi:hypothetical protein
MDNMIRTAQFSTSETRGRAASSATDWQRKMSDHIAYALLTYTGLQIFITIGALKTKGTSLLPYLALIVLVGGIIPACRRFERRWMLLSETQASNPDLTARFRRDRTILWLFALGLPIALTGLFKALTYLIG